MKKIFVAVMSLFFVLILTSCGPSRVVVSDRPNAPYRARPSSPGGGYVWINGDWYWSNGRYSYREGYWSRPRGHRAWHEGRWERRGSGWYWRKGRWH